MFFFFFSGRKSLYCLLLITYYSLLITHYSLLITYYLLLITHYSLLKNQNAYHEMHSVRHRQ
ncbi:MAG: hypothetical protein F6K47_06535 [Symploca sp. SIO2E6]|nr:hypothetical protein [Symploca sp. SIO2E6]